MFQVVRSDMLKSFLHIVEDVGLYDDGKSKREKEVVSELLIHITGTARPSVWSPGLSNTTQITMCAHQQLRCTAAGHILAQKKKIYTLCVYTFGIHGTYT